MKIINKIIAILVVAFLAWLAFVWPTLKVELEGSMVYRQSDFREYYLLTHDLLKEMPRISDDYFSLLQMCQVR